MIVVVGFGCGSPSSVIVLLIRFHRLLISFVDSVIVFPTRRSSFTIKRAEMSAELLIHEGGKLFHATWNVEIFWNEWLVTTFWSFNFPRWSQTSRRLLSRRRRCFTIGSESVTASSRNFGRESGRDNMSSYLSVQRRVEISIALNVATASNGNLWDEIIESRLDAPIV